MTSCGLKKNNDGNADHFACLLGWLAGWLAARLFGYSRGRNGSLVRWWRGGRGGVLFILFADSIFLGWLVGWSVFLVGLLHLPLSARFGCVCCVVARIGTRPIRQLLLPLCLFAQSLVPYWIDRDRYTAYISQAAVR